MITPTSAQVRTYIAALHRIDPGLVADKERAIRRAERICERMQNPDEAGSLTLEKYVVDELSGGNATINKAQARQVIKAVRAWCP